MDSKKEKRRFSIQLKLLLTMSLLTSGAIGIFTFFANDLFRKDRQAYIFEGAASLLESVGFGLEVQLENLAKDLGQIQNSPESFFETQQDSPIFENWPDLLAIKIDLAGKEDPWVLAKKVDLKTKKNLMRIEKANPGSLAFVDAKTYSLDNPSLPGMGPIFRVLLPKNQVTPFNLTAFFRSEILAKNLNRSKIFDTFLLDGLGRTLIHKNQKFMVPAHSFVDEKVFAQIIDSLSTRGATEYSNSQGEKFLLAYAKIGEKNLILFSEISSDKAFLVTRKLAEKSLLFGLLLVALFILVSIGFSKKLTGPLKILYEATHRVSQGNFDIRIGIKSRDEIGSLAESFTLMTQKIKTLLVETADKARMDKELETAKTVQDSLFPSKDYHSQNLQLASYYRPASECGGDWWGYLDLDDRFVLYIGDATGHGVPAALITAAVQSACTTLYTISQQKQHWDFSPDQILKILNRAVFEASRGKIKMTFFVGVYDFNTKALEYANASHDTPLVLLKPVLGQDLSRESIDVLDGNPGPALGQHPESDYKTHSYQFHEQDKLVIFTDGLTEGRNAKKDEWGEKRLIRTLFKGPQGNSEELKTLILGKSQEFFGSFPQEDDITLVVVNFGNPLAKGKAA